MSEIRDISLAAEGEDKIRWAKRNMPILSGIEKRFTIERPFEGLKIALSVHLEAKTACLCRVLAAGGAEMHVTGCNPLSTQDAIAAAVAAGGMDVHAWRGATEDEYERHLRAVLKPGPNIIIDDGGDLITLVTSDMRELIPGIIGGCEETTTGIRRLRAMDARGELPFPMIMVNDADCKHLFDNRYGTGQSVWDGILRTTNLCIPGKSCVIAGYGWCGKGVSMRARGLGARVIITETDPIRAIEAAMDGFEVMPMAEAVKIGDLFVCVTGCRDIITAEHFPQMRDGAVLCNAGHFNVEIDIDALAALSKSRYSARNNIEGFVQDDGREIFVLAEGRLVNIAAADGHPIEIMDMSFAVQALSAEFLALHGAELQKGVAPVPKEIDTEVAFLKLRTLGIKIDSLSGEQSRYLNS